MTYVITEGCVDMMDRSCLAQCPVDCITPGERMLYIDPDSCIDCGACESACPQTAIVWEPVITPEKAPYVAINAEFFTDGLSAGTDHPAVASLPKK